MGAVPSTPRNATPHPQDAVEYLIGTFVGNKSFPFSSEFWQNLLELPLDLRWSNHHLVHQACELFEINNHHTRHLAKILVHLACCLRESMMSSADAPLAYRKTINVVHIASVFLKHLIENTKSKITELYLSFDGKEPMPKDIIGGVQSYCFV